MFRHDKPVTVLGAGPTGLLAAHAAEMRGWAVTVFSAPDADGNPLKSELHGCQYLHRYIPALDLPSAGRRVGYILNGEPDEYRRKVYGENWSGQVSPDEYGPERTHEAWDLRQVYDALWERWQDRIMPSVITPKVAASMAHRKGLIFCTIPAQALCTNEEHKFVTQDIWAMGERVGKDGGPVYPLPFRAPEMTVLCNSDTAPRWYRAATVFGVATLEWPAGPKPPVSGVAAVRKPLSTDCDCHVTKRWVRLGRYGKWQKGVLVHSAFEEVLDL